MSEEVSPIIGHEKVQAQLFELISKGKLPHAILLSGPRGIGKFTVADILAKCLLTGEGDKPESSAADSLFGDELSETSLPKLKYDETHPAIARIESGGHGNIKIVEPLCDEKRKMTFTTINVEQIREVVEFMHLSTSEGGWRIVIIDPADGMNRNAENALLKVLEEPPKQTLLVLVSHQPDKLLPTTRSRCREIKLHPPTAEQVIEILSYKSKTVTEEQKEWLTKLAPSSPGSWLNHIEFEADKTYSQWLNILDNPNIADIQKLTAAFAKLDTEPWKLTGDLFLTALHRLSIFVNNDLDLLPVEKDIFSKLQKKHPSEHWLDIWSSAVYWLPQTIGGNYDKKQVLQSLLFQASSGAKKSA